MPFFLFILLPILELVVFIQVGAKIGVLWVLALIFLSSMLGFALLRNLGTYSFIQMQERLRRGELPMQELGQSLWLAMASMLLIIPGFITSITGLLLMIPVTRKALAVLFARVFKLKMNAYPKSGEKEVDGVVIVEEYRIRQDDGQPRTRHTIEGEFKED